MKIIKEDNALVIKSWCENPEDGAIEQAKNLAKLPFAFKQICLMADTHLGYGMPIGGVLATKDVIVPNAVGSDISCGMHIVKTSLKTLHTNILKEVVGKMREKVPMGFNHNKIPQDIKYIPQIATSIGYKIVNEEFKSALKQVGTGGSSNHFLEVQKGDDGFIYFMVHSGSRNLGKKVADYYNNVAKELNKKWFSSVPPEWDLAYLPLEIYEAQEYLKEMHYCMEFAKCNRDLIAERIKEAFSETIKDVEFTWEYDINHNYARMENHFGHNVLVHRKGATSAKKDEIGLIPGSQGTYSYIVKGKGNPESFQSCSHGAGRKMGRKQAEKTLNLTEELKKLNDQGILHTLRGVHNLDEASGAYKDIKTIMSEQADLVDIMVELKPLAVIKG